MPAKLAKVASGLALMAVPMVGIALFVQSPTATAMVRAAGLLFSDPPLGAQSHGPLLDAVCSDGMAGPTRVMTSTCWRSCRTQTSAAAAETTSGAGLIR